MGQRTGRHHAQSMPLETDNADFKWRRASSQCGAVASGLGILGFLSWLLNLPIVSSFSFRYVPMSLWGALSFALLGLALWLHVSQPPNRLIKFCVSTFAVLAFVVSAASVFQFLGDVPPSRLFRLGVDLNQPLAKQISRPAAVGFMLAAGGVLSLGAARRRAEW